MFRLQLPPPANWQDFESLCLDVWRELWRDPYAQKNGRQGQKQAGVDVFGQPFTGLKWHGVQCKLRSASEGGLTISEVKKEIEAASTFKPELGNFTIAHTGKRDAKLQSAVRRLSERRTKHALFAVQLYSWADLSEVIQGRSHLLQRLYPQLGHEVLRQIDGSVQTTIYASSNAISDCLEIFESAEVKCLLAEELRIELRNVATELVLNSFEHGAASHSTVTLTRDSMLIQENGKVFNPFLTHAGGAGLTYLHHFVQKWAGLITTEHTLDHPGNQIMLRAAKPWISTDFSRSCTILLKQRYVMGPILPLHAEFDPGCEEYSLIVPRGFFNPSSLIDFLIAFLQKVGREVRIRLKFTQDEVLEETIRHSVISGWCGLDPARVIID